MQLCVLTLPSSHKEEPAPGAIVEKARSRASRASRANQRKQATTDSLEKILEDLGVSEADIYEGQAEIMQVPFLDLDFDQGRSGAVLNSIPEDAGSL